MYIRLDKLKELGFEVELTEKAISIFPVTHNNRTSRLIDGLSEQLKFNCSEHDELLNSVINILTISVIKRASE